MRAQASVETPVVTSSAVLPAASASALVLVSPARAISDRDYKHYTRVFNTLHLGINLTNATRATLGAMFVFITGVLVSLGYILGDNNKDTIIELVTTVAAALLCIPAGLLINSYAKSYLEKTGKIITRLPADHSSTISYVDQLSSFKDEKDREFYKKGVMPIAGGASVACLLVGALFMFLNMYKKKPLDSATAITGYMYFMFAGLSVSFAQAFEFFSKKPEDESADSEMDAITAAASVTPTASGSSTVDAVLDRVIRNHGGAPDDPIIQTVVPTVIVTAPSDAVDRANTPSPNAFRRAAAALTPSPVVPDRTQGADRRAAPGGLTQGGASPIPPTLPSLTSLTSVSSSAFLGASAPHSRHNSADESGALSRRSVS